MNPWKVLRIILEIKICYSDSKYSKLVNDNDFRKMFIQTTPNVTGFQHGAGVLP